MRVLIVGTAGSGKSTLSARLSRQFTIPHVELDALFWGPGWTEPDRTVFRAAVLEKLVCTPDWIVDGNYRSVREDVVAGADVVIWLDYPGWVCRWRLARRTVIRALRRDVLANGNRESVRKLFQTRFEFFRWSALEHERLRKEIPAIEVSGAPPIVIRVRRRRDLRDLERMLSSTASRDSARQATRPA